MISTQHVSAPRSISAAISMFSADLSWTDPNTEKVGERKNRKARERSTVGDSSNTSISSTSSADHEAWWTTGLRKANSIKPKFSRLRPSTGRSSASKHNLHAVPESKDYHAYSSPMVQPDSMYSGTFAAVLPSEGAMDVGEHEVPELEGDASSRQTDSRFSCTCYISHIVRKQLIIE